MQKKQLRSAQIVAKFLQSNSTLQVEMLSDIAKKLCKDHRCETKCIAQMVPLLQRALNDDRLFEHLKGGLTTYLTESAMRRQLGIPQGAPKLVLLDAIAAELVLV